MRAYLLTVAVLATAVYAQNPASPTEKKEPESRRVELPASPGVQNPPLPKIELPEYIITGIISMNVPNVHKEDALETSRPVDVRAYHITGSRERVTVELENRQKESLLSGSRILNGQATVSMANYFTPRVDVWLGQTMPDYDYRVSAGYHRTKGFVPHSDRSGGHMGISGGLVFNSGAMEGSRLGGNASYGTEVYRFYGSLVPATRRTVSNYRFGVSLAPAPSNSFLLTPSLDYRYHGVTDSSAETQQQRATVSLNAELPLDAVTLLGSMTYDNASLSGAHSGHLTQFQLRLGTSRYWWNSIFVKGAVDFSAVKGMAGQRLSRVYPDVAAGYVIGGSHLASVSYTGGIGFTDLALQIKTNPYLSAGSVILHPEKVRQIRLVVESDWSPVIRTTISASNETVYNYGLMTDPLGSGIWSLSYGLAKFWSYRAEAFAKLTPNDYVSATVTVNSTEGAPGGRAVPYVPKFETAASYTHWFPFGLSVSPTISYQGVREAGFAVSQELPGFFLAGLRAEYEPIVPLTVFVDLHNISNKKYELWKGYQAPPFMVTGGLSFRW